MPPQVGVRSFSISLLLASYPRESSPGCTLAGGRNRFSNLRWVRVTLVPGRARRALRLDVSVRSQDLGCEQCFVSLWVVSGGMGLGFGPGGPEGPEGPFQPLGLDVSVLCQD